MIIKKCIVCNSFFEADCNRRKFCSRQCYFDHLGAKANCDFFEQPSADMAYVLGVVVSDGCLVRKTSGNLTLQIKSIDKQMLEDIASLMDSQYQIRESGVTQSGNAVWLLNFGHRKIIADLKKWGVVERKTFKTIFPPLPEEYCRDFIRGLFDGDGCVSSYHCNTLHNDFGLANILGTKELLDPIPQIIGIKDNIVTKGKIFNLRVRSHEGLVKMYNTIYYNPFVPCLKRKRDKFDEVLGIIENASQRTHYGVEKAMRISKLLSTSKERCGYNDPKVNDRNVRPAMFGERDVCGENI